MPTSSPFLHRENVVSQHGQFVYHEDAQRFREACERERARITLERLRYRWWARRGTLACRMQRIGDFGRKYFGFLDRKQTGGGWW